MAQFIVHLNSQQDFKACCKRLGKLKKRHTSYPSLNAIAISTQNRQEVLELLNDSEVQSLVEDMEVKLIVDEKVETPALTAQSSIPWGLERIGATYSSIPSRYHRPKIAVLDTGLSLHPALSISKTHVNFSKETNPADLNGHGTHIGGIIAGFGSSLSKSFHGVYPKLKLYSIKAFNKQGSTELSAILKGIDWAIRKKMNIINMSFGLDRHVPVLHDAIKTAVTKGIIMVAASGNNGAPRVAYPAQYPEVIAVGSINRNDHVSSFSQYGSSLDLVAPGEDIFSTWINKSYQSSSGTSMACGHVSGVAALILAYKPDYTVEQVKSVLFENTEKLYSSYLRQGNGLVSIKNIVSYLRSQKNSS